ncbi:MAG: transcription elongation factor GreA [Albidovulum sp.]|nr:transcription elongation factor GreA [Albidovulum sp.]MDE0307223.1 transcription elongation factor GreA [Albidovulum sp.]MDE0531951.1 transcription elongation factor GreA [Albidovulum sp.]
MKKILMTPEGLQSLNEEAKRLKSVERPAIIKEIAEARAHGDLSENAEYNAAREQQSLIEGRIKELESFIGRAEVVKVSKLSGSVKFGATVTLEDDETLEKKTFQIVSEAEASIERGLLNIGSPLARALIGKDEGDYAEVNTPGGEKSYTILEIKYL